MKRRDHSVNALGRCVLCLAWVDDEESPVDLSDQHSDLCPGVGTYSLDPFVARWVSAGGGDERTGR
jgi:hypothetical protein